MTVDQSKNFWRIRQESPKHFSRMRVPVWSSRVADSVVPGAKVVMGRKKGAAPRAKGAWRPQSILIPKKPGRTRVAAIKQAKAIKEKLKGGENE